MCVAAHPDDEDGATLAYYTKLWGYNAYTIFYTRGEGGQNEIGPELNDELGKIREKECNDAAAILGSRPYFLGFLDFGYSKTAKETFKMWGGVDSVLARIVYFVRVLRPDVVISNHDTITTKPRRQHGNHQAAGITIFQAFDKAADPSYHPEQLVNGVTPWQIKKLYFRVFDSTVIKGIVTIDANRMDASGKSIDEISWEALSKHRTQGMDKIDRNSIPPVFRERKYQLVRSDQDYPFDPTDLFSGIKPDGNKPDFHPVSYQTVYKYLKVNPKDSLNLLKTLKFDTGAYVGLVRTYDNTLVDVMNAFKIKYDTLSAQDLSSKDLSRYTVILLDLRTYFYRPDALQNNSRLLDYASNGGNIICFYHKQSDWNGKALSPYPISITFDRVTEEDAPVTVLDPYSDFFTRPNKMDNSKDWDGWVQERSIYLPTGDSTKTSALYERLLAMQDEDDPVPSTSLLIAGDGLGSYTYCSLALYRQLRIFNKGALELFLNMISLGRNYGIIERTGDKPGK